MAGVPAQVQVGPGDTSPAALQPAGGRRRAGRQSRAGGGGGGVVQS
jgi:hypothetical protein